MLSQSIQEKIQEKLNPSLFQWDYLGMKPLLTKIQEFSQMVQKEQKKRILDLGCGLKPYQTLFSFTKEYIGVDKTKNQYVDVIADVSDLPFTNNYFDALILTQVLEHTFSVKQTLEEIKRVTKKNGLIFISAPFAFPEHEEPNDFFRFSRYAFQKLLAKDFAILEITPLNGYLNTLIRLWNHWLKFFPLSRWLFAPIFAFNNLLALFLDKLAYVISKLPNKTLQDGYQRLYLGFPENYVVIARKL